MAQTMGLAIYALSGFGYPFAELVKLIKNAGFQSVMTWWGDEYRETNGPKELEPDIVRNNGLTLENTHISFTGANAIWQDSLDGQELFNRYLSYLDDCKTYEIPAGVLHVSSGNNPPPYGQLGLDRFRRLVERAEKNGVTIALENLRKPEYLDFIYDNIKSDKLKFCFDSGHENSFTPGFDCLAKYGDKLAALHLHDNDGTDDQHRIPGEGTIDWPEITRKLRGYPGPISVEVTNEFSVKCRNLTAERFLAEAFAQAKGIAEQLILIPG